MEEEVTRNGRLDYVGWVRRCAAKKGQCTGMAVELNASHRIFTLLPVIA